MRAAGLTCPRPFVLVALLSLVVATAAVSTASARVLSGAEDASGAEATAIEPSLDPVANQLQQAYTPGSLATPPEAEATVTFFFEGDATDEATKQGSLVGVTEPTATFRTALDDDPQPAFQKSMSVTNTQFAGNPLAAYWEGPFSGQLDGEVVLDWFFSSTNPLTIAQGTQVNVVLFADPHLAESVTSAPIVGSGTAAIEAGALPTRNTSTIAANGTVQERLLVQVSPVLNRVDEQDLKVHYGTTDTPSRFSLPLSTDGELSPGALHPSQPAAYDGELLEVGATYVGRDAAEPTVGVLSDGSAFYAAGTFDALPEGSPRQLARTEVLRSLDGGATWDSVQPRLPVGYHDNEYGDSGYTSLPPTTLDPYVYVDEDTDRIFNPELYAGCTFLNYSDDRGETWSSNPVACGDYVNDHQTVFTGPPPANLETAGYPNVLYYCFNRVIDSNCGRSLDGGDTWAPTASPAFLGYDPQAGGLCGGLHGHIKTDSEGRLFLPKGHCGFPWLGISEDGGDTWERVQVTDRLPTGTHTHLAVAVDNADNVYYLYWDGQQRLPWLQVSTDHGRTFSEPMMIAPPGVREVNFPVIEGGDTGRVAITFPGTTEEGSTRAWNSYVVASTDLILADGTVNPTPVFLSTTANDPADPVHRGTCEGRCGGMYDFLDVITAPVTGSIWATGTDNCPDGCIDENGEEVASGELGGKPGFVIVQTGGPSMLAAGDGADGDECVDPRPDDARERNPDRGPCAEHGPPDDRAERGGP